MNKVIQGDCLEVLKTLPDNSVDAIVTDPPAGIAFMGKDWDKDKGGKQAWIEWMNAIALECLRVIKPGGHALVWAIPRTSHWTGDAWENAGWGVRDKIYHCFGSGFPKSHNISKAIDKKAGAEREVVGLKKDWKKLTSSISPSNWKTGNRELNITAPATEAAKQWDGWGTALKPAVEEWWLFRKPIEGPIADNVMEWGTGALNIDGCRVGTENTAGRFPAHLIHDGSDEVLSVFSEDKGSAARFFYCAKASKRDRDEGLSDDRNVHPTVKPVDLMQYLCRLITPPSGTVLDPFCGSGSTGKAAVLQGFTFIGIEKEPEYVAIANARIAAAAQRSHTATLEQRVAWLETQTQAISVKVKRLENEQLSLFNGII